MRDNERLERMVEEGPFAALPQAPKRFIFKIDDGETHWYSAVSRDAALEMCAKDADYKTVEEYKEELQPEISVLCDGLIIKVRYEGAPEGQEVREQTARQWADEVDGFLASTVY